MKFLKNKKQPGVVGPIIGFSALGLMSVGSFVAFLVISQICSK